MKRDIELEELNYLLEHFEAAVRRYQTGTVGGKAPVWRDALSWRPRHGPDGEPYTKENRPTFAQIDAACKRFDLWPTPYHLPRKNLK